MLHFSGKIPLTIHPTFWLFAALIGYLISGSFIGTLIWIGIIFISVLFHEYGHALTAAFFGQSPRIELVALGGLTYHNGQSLAFWKQFFIVFNGPLFGFLLFIAASFLLQIPSLAQGAMGSVLTTFRAVNLFWTVVNLLPVIPLDGGQLIRIVLEAIFGARGFKYALIASMVIATLVSLFFFLQQSLIVGALFFLLAFQSFDSFRKTRHFSENDRDESLRECLRRAEEQIQLGHQEEAQALLEKVRASAKEGIIFTLATQYLAFLNYEKGKKQEAYQLLLFIREDLASDALCLLHKVAFDCKDFHLVTELAGSCFQTWPTVETALRNAYAHGALAEVVPAVGWLQTAIQQGAYHLDDIFADKNFDGIRHHPSFQQLIAASKKQNF